MKTLLIAISTTILLLFTSCEDEMGGGGTTGGGKDESMNGYVNSVDKLTPIIEDKEISFNNNCSDSLFHSSNNLSR
ncbi:hypothetical protein G7051_06765 [Dysgonomonas sp. HDW5B]|uniref:hypothetical protein n=1 Tax=Dysgonomonas sp. HDW5B TaxID=2714927 RepID=UPI00140AB377|nr:hypothetical protein [Dysgonomonas sp. HDW5B]QIK54048.1 hypothetical protein G7051_06765 [Dysgonomonas sp. HDW5B]